MNKKQEWIQKNLIILSIRSYGGININKTLHSNNKEYIFFSSAHDMFTKHDQKTAANPIKYRAILKQHALEKEMANHSSILAWRIPWTEEPGGLQSTGSQRVGYDWATSLSFSPLSWEDSALVFAIDCFLEFSKTCDHIFFRLPVF